MDLSFVISPSDEPEQTRACLESLARTVPPSFRHETCLAGAEEPGVPAGVNLRFVPCDRARGLAAARNAAAAVSQAPTLCFLSPGTVLMPGWLPPMLDLLRNAPNAGCIGNVHREPYSGLIEHAGLRFEADGQPTPVAQGRPLLPRERVDRQPAVSLACALVPRRVFDAVGGFDERFMGSLADVDFCLRAAASGHRHFVANRSVVYHAANALPDPDPGTDQRWYRTLWGDRARAAYERRKVLRRRLSWGEYTREAWEMARENRRLQRQEITDERRDGRGYVWKHLHRPWRYNHGRLCRALEQALRPLPAALPLTPGQSRHDDADTSRPDDGWLFDPPPQ